MKYKEFEKWCEENGYKVSYSEESIHVCMGIVSSIISSGAVSKKHRNSMSITSSDGVSTDLFFKMVELANTPIEDRVDQKLYHVILPTYEDSFEALSKDLGIIQMYGYHDDDLKLDRFRFTEKQIKAIDERYMAFAEEVEQ